MTQHSTPQPSIYGPQSRYAPEALLPHPSWCPQVHTRVGYPRVPDAINHDHVETVVELRLGTPDAVPVEVSLSRWDYLDADEPGWTSDGVHVLVSELVTPDAADGGEVVRQERLTLSTLDDALALGQALVAAAEAGLRATTMRRAG